MPKCGRISACHAPHTRVIAPLHIKHLYFSGFQNLSLILSGRNLKIIIRIVPKGNDGFSVIGILGAPDLFGKRYGRKIKFTVDEVRKMLPPHIDQLFHIFAKARRVLKRSPAAVNGNVIYEAKYKRIVQMLFPALLFIVNEAVGGDDFRENESK